MRCGELEAEHVAVEVECAVEVGDFEVDMADARFRMNGRHGDWIPRGAERCPSYLTYLSSPDLFFQTYCSGSISLRSRCGWCRRRWR